MKVTTDTLVRAWIAVGLLGYVALPWYAVQDGAWYSVLPQVLGGTQTASGLVQAVIHGRKWLLIGMAGFAIAMASLGQPPGRLQGRWLLGGGLFGALGLLAFSFLIDGNGWTVDALTARFGALPRGQAGMGIGAMVALVALAALVVVGARAMGKAARRRV